LRAAAFAAPAAGLAHKPRLDVRQPKIIGPAITADRDRVAAAIVLGVTSWLRRASLVFHIANDCLSAAVHMDVLDADILVAPTTQASENLYLHRKRFHQTSRG
jgi:hypothetical protein